MIIQCRMCGFPYEVPQYFKYCQCENCPWVMIESAPYTYGIIQKKIVVPRANMIYDLYEEIAPKNYRVVRDEDVRKKKLQEKKKRRKIRIPSRYYDYGSLVQEYEKQARVKFIKIATTILTLGDLNARKSTGKEPLQVGTC